MSILQRISKWFNGEAEGTPAYVPPKPPELSPVAAKICEIIKAGDHTDVTSEDSPFVGIYFRHSSFRFHLAGSKPLGVTIAASRFSHFEDDPYREISLDDIRSFPLFLCGKLSKYDETQIKAASLPVFNKHIRKENEERARMESERAKEWARRDRSLLDGILSYTPIKREEKR